ncbi:MAG: PKD domain-containing protein, partial [Planctomycetota bacterium]
GDTVSFTDQSTGSVTSWLWNFGDSASSNQQNPTHSYSNSGVYTVSLTVSGTTGSDTETKTNYITVTPRADFTGTPASGPGELSVNFIDQSAGQVTSWSWNFGDGQTSTQQSPTHNYTSAGNFTVVLTVSGPHGNDTMTKTDYISVTGPGVDFSGTPRSGVEPLTVSFTASVTGTVTQYDWDFGDGGSSSTQHPTHVYAAPGTYTVSLSATGPCGSETETKVGYITVTPRPEDDSGGSCTCSSPGVPAAPSSIFGAVFPFLCLVLLIGVLRKPWKPSKKEGR